MNSSTVQEAMDMLADAMRRWHANEFGPFYCAKWRAVSYWHELACNFWDITHVIDEDDL